MGTKRSKDWLWTAQGKSALKNFLFENRSLFQWFSSCHLKQDSPDMEGWWRFLPYFGEMINFNDSMFNRNICGHVRSHMQTVSNSVVPKTISLACTSHTRMCMCLFICVYKWALCQKFKHCANLGCEMCTKQRQSNSNHICEFKVRLEQKNQQIQSKTAMKLKIANWRQWTDTIWYHTILHVHIYSINSWTMLSQPNEN